MAHPLRHYRTNHSIGIGAMAARLGISRQSLHRLENGEQEPSAALLRRIAEETAGAVLPNDMLALSSALAERQRRKQGEAA